MASLGPSERLLNQRRSNKITWHEFKKRYRAELFESKSFDRRNRVIKNHGQKFTLRLLQILARRGPSPSCAIVQKRSFIATAMCRGRSLREKSAELALIIRAPISHRRSAMRKRE